MAGDSLDVELRVPANKITGYLLNVDHPQGGPKARFFLECGFSLDRPQDFVEALFDHCMGGKLPRQMDGLWGIKFIYDGPLPTPDGRNPMVRSVWILSRTDPRYFDLVTAYPL